MHRRPTNPSRSEPTDVQAKLQGLREMVDDLVEQLQSTQSALNRAATELAHLRRAVPGMNGTTDALPFRSVHIDGTRGEARLDDVVVSLPPKLLALLRALAEPGTAPEQDGFVPFKTLETLQHALAAVGPRPTVSDVRTSMWRLGKLLAESTGLPRKDLLGSRRARSLRSTRPESTASTKVYRLNLLHPSTASARHATRRM